MAIRAWVLVQTEVGHARPLADAVGGYVSEGVRVLSADTVTGPHDVIVHIEAADVDSLTEAAEAALTGIAGVEHITTCIVLP